MTPIAWMFVLFLVCAALATVVVAVVRRSAQSNAGRPSDEDGGGGGGSVRRGPVPPRGPSNEGEPPWWPQFERDFAQYVARRRPGRQPAMVRPPETLNT
jgi:hypothetical protein